jgi:hypothetical protein
VASKRVSAQIPVGQHFVSKMLLRRFTDQNGNLFFFSKLCPQKGVLTTTPAKLFRKRHIYTAEDKRGVKDVALENHYAEMEGLANSIIEKIVSSARQGREPRLTAKERDIWDSFFYDQWRRVPDLHGKFLEKDSFESFIQHAVDAVEARRGPLGASAKRDIQDPSWLERVKQNAKVEALKGNSPEILTLLRTKGLGIIVIRNPGASFVIGSFPVVKLTKPGHEHLADPTVEVWLPVAHDVAVSPAPNPPGTELVVEITGDAPVRALNIASFKQSTAIAGRSASLIASLVNHR